jgi:hypothetical protein
MGILYSGGPNRPTRREDQLTGTVTRLGNMTIQVWMITVDANGNYVSAALDATTPSWPTDAQGNANPSQITVAGAVGTLYRLVIPDDGQKRAFSWDQLAE